MTTPKTRTHAKTAETLGGEQALAEALCVNVYARAQAVEALALQAHSVRGDRQRRFQGPRIGCVGRVARALKPAGARIEQLYFREGGAPVPYLPLLMMPYYVYVGRVPAAGL
jgi:hypothetical protein